MKSKQSNNGKNSSKNKYYGISKDEVSILNNMSIRERINSICSMHNIPTELVEFSSIMTSKTDEKGERFYEDMNSVVRYYPEKGRVGVVEETDEFKQNKAIAKSPQRELSLYDLY
jgi:hypothetical protein